MKKTQVILSEETDGNAFIIIAKVTSALRNNNEHDKAAEFEKKALKADSYQGMLKLIFDYVEVV